MRQRYLLLTEIGNEIRFFSLTTNQTGRAKLRRLSRRMLQKLLPHRRIRKLMIRKWPFLR